MLKLKNLLVLGGCGLIGAEVVKDLAATSEFEKITVADGNYDKAVELIKSLDDSRFSARKVEIKNKDEVVSLMKEGFDLVCNCLPFEFDTYITQCCVDAGVTGTDLGATKDQLAMNSTSNKVLSMAIYQIHILCLLDFLLCCEVPSL